MRDESRPESPPLLSVIIPAFNEARTIAQVIAAVQAVDIDKEIIAVDDGSTDGTRETLEAIARSDATVRVSFHSRNKGKGAAIRTGLAAARGQYVLVQDADLEYQPSEYPKLLKPL